MTFFDLFRSFYESWRYNSNRKHDERLGQRLYNEMRKDELFNGKGKPYDSRDIVEQKAIIADRIWNITDKDFIAYLERFFE